MNYSIYLSLSLRNLISQFAIYDDASVDPFLAGIEGEERRGQRPAAEEAEAAEDAPAGGNMDTD